MSLTLRLMMCTVVGIVLISGCSSNDDNSYGSGGGGGGTLLFNSGDLTNGQSFEYVFDSVGVFPYHCKYHVSMGMSGTIMVTAGGTPSKHQYDITAIALPTMTIDIGDTMRWTNMMSIKHTIQSDN